MHSPCLYLKKKKSRRVVCHTVKYVEIIPMAVHWYRNIQHCKYLQMQLAWKFHVKALFLFLMKNDVSIWVVIGWYDAPLSNVMTSHTPHPVRRLVLVKWLYPCPVSIKLLCYRCIIVTMNNFFVLEILNSVTKNFVRLFIKTRMIADAHNNKIWSHTPPPSPPLDSTRSPPNPLVLTCRDASIQGPWQTVFYQKTFFFNHLQRF